jgi:hypothetical protein
VPRAAFVVSAWTATIFRRAVGFIRGDTAISLWEFTARPWQSIVFRRTVGLIRYTIWISTGNVVASRASEESPARTRGAHNLAVDR